jgi:hypothetical protein
MLFCGSSIREPYAQGDFFVPRLFISNHIAGWINARFLFVHLYSRFAAHYRQEAASSARRGNPRRVLVESVHAARDLAHRLHLGSLLQKARPRWSRDE